MNVVVRTILYDYVIQDRKFLPYERDPRREIWLNQWVLNVAFVTLWLKKKEWSDVHEHVRVWDNYCMARRPAVRVLNLVPTATHTY